MERLTDQGISWKGGSDSVSELGMCPHAMKTVIFKYWDSVRSSFWFVPSIMASGAGVLSLATVALDQSISEAWLKELAWIYTGGSEGASAVLQIIASSMITIAGVVFSMTLVALSLASSQLGPRLMRNFMRDTSNQVVLGTFIATFLYCLLVLRTIRRAEEIAFVPHLSVTLGLAFALASLGVLIYFIHHVSVSIQADEIIAHVNAELNAGIEHMFPVEMGVGKLPQDISVDQAFDAEAEPVIAAEDGYLQLIDVDSLMALASQHDALFRVECRPGRYVIEGNPLVMVWPRDRLNEELALKIRSTFALGTQRTSAQDLEFSVDQLVEIAARALSTGINDPFTAISCVDRLASALAKLARRDFPSPYRLDDDERLRVVACPFTFEGIAGATFNPIRQHARGNAAVTIRLLEVIADIARLARREDDLAVLRTHASMIVRGAREALSEPNDIKTAERRFDEAWARLAPRVDG